MMPHDHETIQRVLADQPLCRRLAHLTASLLATDNAKSVLLMLEFAMMMTRHLPIHQQTMIRWHLAEAITELKTRWQ
jgi:hypothetical protein